MEEVVQDIEDRILFQYGTDAEKLQVFEARFGLLVGAAQSPKLTLLLGDLSASEAFRQFSRLVRKLCPGEPLFLQETIRQVEAKLEEKGSVLARARCGTPTPECPRCSLTHYSSAHLE